MLKPITWARAHPGAAAGVVAAGVVVLALGVYWFAPQNLFIDERVDEALPGGAGLVGSEAESDDAMTGGTEGAGDMGAAGTDEPTVLASGRFTSLEHATSGRALIVEVPDGSRYLRLEDLQTSNGPDLRVYLTDQPLSDDWRVWDDGRFVDLGGLKGNVGSSNYEIPADVNVADYRTAVIWCRRFTVGFGVAPVETG